MVAGSVLDKEDVWVSTERLEEDRGVLEARSEIDAVLETGMLVGVIVSTLDGEPESTELEDEKVDELWLTSDDEVKGIELLVELEASVVIVTDEEIDWISDELLVELVAISELDKDEVSDVDADGVARDEV